ncbi:hypothetical protein TEA_003506 [Camellia sinensis var. sinensis]|uniref:ABC transporter domain-containing protein n=1 Tax=Camellia sinensis var. sinensis TaxID=542762 RepID=A0A4S4DZM5_CAMSN|nr:hypothetical protein TEA_003506 [Camellia sinensis var. sinensis]
MTLNASASASASATATFAKPLCPPCCKTLVKQFLLSSSRHVFITNSHSMSNSTTLTAKPNKLKFRVSTCRVSTSSLSSVQLQQQEEYEEDDSQSTQLFEKLKDVEREHINKLEELGRKANIQLERQLVMTSDWSRKLLTMQGKLRGSEWDPENSHRIDYSQFLRLFNSNNVQFMEYSNNGQTISVILPYYKDEKMEGPGDSKKELIFWHHVVDLVWSLRLALSITVYLWIDNMMRPIYAKLIPSDLGTPPKKTRQPVKLCALGSLGKSRNAVNEKFAIECRNLSFSITTGQGILKPTDGFVYVKKPKSFVFQNPDHQNLVRYLAKLCRLRVSHSCIIVLSNTDKKTKVPSNEEQPEKKQKFDQNKRRSGSRSRSTQTPSKSKLGIQEESRRASWSMGQIPTVRWVKIFNPNDLNGSQEAGENLRESWELRMAGTNFSRRSSTSRRHSSVFQASAEGPLFIFIISNDEALSMLKLNEDVVGDSKARVSEQMEIRSAVEMAQLEVEKKHDEVVDEMLAMLNAKAEASRLKEVEQEAQHNIIPPQGSANVINTQVVMPTVESDLAFGLHKFNLTPDEIKSRLARALDAVGMFEYLKTPVQTLSGGQKQRVAIAGALAEACKVLLLDELTTFLDEGDQIEVIKAVKNSLQKSKDVTALWVTHRLEELEYADGAVYMEDGRVVMHGDVSTILDFITARQNSYIRQINS